MSPRIRYLVLGPSRVVIAAALVAFVAGAIAVARPWSWCPSDWSGAARVELPDGFGTDVVLDGKPYRIGGTALLDYAPRGVFSPMDQVVAMLRIPQRHPLTVTDGDGRWCATTVPRQRRHSIAFWL